MGRRRMALALLVFILGTSALAAGVRTHDKFAATSYYSTDDTPTITSKDSTTETTVDPNDRYPDGYPGQTHHYNSVTGKYDGEETSKTSTETSTLPTEKTTTTATTTETTTQGNIPKRYEAGYTNGHGSFQQYSTSNMPDNQPDEFTLDPVEGRYKNGYYPKSTYAGASQKTTTTTTSSTNGGVSYSVQNSDQQKNSLEGDFSHRYEHGYFPTSTYTQQSSSYNQQGVSQTNPVTYSSYTGQFSTMPTPSAGVPFIASGAGCRTAYWVEHIDMWPKFITVKSTVGEEFGAQATATFGETTILQGLMKYGNDPYNEVLRTGCTALLNAFTRGAYGISHMKVIEQFNAALVSKEAAKAQALVFETENVESISAGTACT